MTILSVNKRNSFFNLFLLIIILLIIIFINLTFIWRKSICVYETTKFNKKYIINTNKSNDSNLNQKDLTAAQAWASCGLKKPISAIPIYIHNKERDGYIENNILYLKGSDSLNTFLYDLDFGRKKFINGYVVSGYLKYFQSILSQIKKYSIYKIVGWSRGGCLGQLIALYYHTYHNKIIHVYTFGAPPIASKKLSLYYNKILGSTTYNLVYNFDLVYMFYKIIGYHSLGEPHFIQDSFNYSIFEHADYLR
tara:strand:+ start:4023 stop:4772 length:750 start_codon:yes stop_codon:yes gene_type:complete